MSEDAIKEAGAPEADETGRNRREFRRIPATEVPVTAAFSPGPDVRLIDLSRGGARFECERRLLPGSNVSLRLVAPEGPVIVRGRVVRSRIAKIDQGGLVYEVAAAFNETLTAIAGEPAEEAPTLRPPDERAVASPQAAIDATAPGAEDDWSDAITVTATVSQSRDELREIFNGNNW